MTQRKISINNETDPFKRRSTTEHECGCFSFPRHIAVKVGHYLLVMFSPPKISWTVEGIKTFTIKLGYNGHGYNEFMAITNKTR